jgi:hypothetical protein
MPARDCSAVHANECARATLGSSVDGPCNKLFARSRFTRDKDRGITSRNFGDAREHSLQCSRGSNNFFKHGSLIDFLAQSHVFAAKPVFRLLPVFDVRQGSIPTRNLSLFVAQWVVTAQKPTIVPSRLRSRNSNSKAEPPERALSE